MDRSQTLEYPMLKAAAAIDDRNMLVKFSSGDFAVTTGRADRVLGAISTTVKEGQYANVAFCGVVELIADGVIPAGARVCPSAAAGKSGFATEADTAGDRVCAIALEAAEDGDIFKALLVPGGAEVLP